MTFTDINTAFKGSFIIYIDQDGDLGVSGEKDFESAKAIVEGEIGWDTAVIVITTKRASIQYATIERINN